MSALFKIYSLAKVIHLLIRFKKTKSSLRNTKSNDINGNAKLKIMQLQVKKIKHQIRNKLTIKSM